MPPNTTFHFKQFTINQDRCAMKVTSDACIFGAWIELQQNSRVLDVGTGTGLLSLMAAQKCDLVIDAVEIDVDAAEQARENVAESPWKERITVINRSLQKHAAIKEMEGAYDTIICNPPFYDQKRKPQDYRKRIAWHSERLNLDHLVKAVDHLMSGSGSLFLLIPFSVKNKLELICETKNLYPRKLCGLCSFENRPPHRLMAEFTRFQQSPEISELIVYQTKNEYSLDCKRLLCSFFASLP